MSLIILAEATQKADGLAADKLFGMILTAVLVILLIPFCFVVLRKAFKISEKQLQFQQRQCVHMDATERHMAVVDQTLAQILEELKRRPLS